MIIDENTKVIGRFHSVASPRGLNIYNPLFEELNINALYILFFNPNPKKLMDGLRSLNLAGAITAGFETDSRMAKLVDKFDDMARYLGKVGFVKNTNGVVKAYSQGGEGMFRTISKVCNLSKKKVIIVGAGHVASSLLYFISKQRNLKIDIEIYNRTIKKANALAKEFNFIQQVGTLTQLEKASGDVLVNLTHIGGSEKDNLFNKQIVAKYDSVVDVTFQTENTNLVKVAKKLRKKVATGWDMFTYQGQVVLETILDTKISSDILRKHVVNGLSEVVK